MHCTSISKGKYLRHTSLLFSIILVHKAEKFKYCFLEWHTTVLNFLNAEYVQLHFWQAHDCATHFLSERAKNRKVGKLHQEALKWEFPFEIFLANTFNFPPLLVHESEIKLSMFSVVMWSYAKCNCSYSINRSIFLIFLPNWRNEHFKIPYTMILKLQALYIVAFT